MLCNAGGMALADQPGFDSSLCPLQLCELLVFPSVKCVTPPSSLEFRLTLK